MDVFIVRPFGVKKVLKENLIGNPTAVEIDFEKVQEELLDPAMTSVNLKGGTTGKIFESGDIRADMFSLLLLADIVIADITIHNANAFYELGIRHALRDSKTILIKSPGMSETPFDILGYRYLNYDYTNPGAALPELQRMIKETMNAERVDSPVFQVLPKLKAQNYEKFLVIPDGFSEEVRNAQNSGAVGKLSLLAYEAEDFNWAIPGLRLIGEALYQSRAFDLARLVWEKVKAKIYNDLNANDRLATIYQRLAEKELAKNPALGAELLSKSDGVMQILLRDLSILEKDQIAEFYALRGRNKKAKWVSIWRNLPADQRATAALQSEQLDEAISFYELGYHNNLNHYYAGINALSLRTIQSSLAQKYATEWENKFSTKKEADRALEDINDKKDQIAAAMRLTLSAEEEMLKQKGEQSIWLNITEADFVLLTEASVGRVTSVYSSALQTATAFSYDALQRQLTIFKDLNILAEKVDAALKTIPAKYTGQAPVMHTLLFTGHMIDEAGRNPPRFVEGQVDAAKEQIRKLVSSETADKSKTYLGISGGACGGDILFHEVCAELGIQTELYLALPREEFIKKSVAFAGPSWIDRFNKLYDKLTRYTLCDTADLPKWLEKKENYTIWTRNNLWELYSSLINGGSHLSVIALWDGGGGDGPGGTQHMVNEAKSKGAKVLVIDTKTLGA